MAAITPTSVHQASLGSMKLTVGKFSSISQGDYWETGIKDIIFAIPVMTQLPVSATAAGTGITFTAATGVVHVTVTDPAGTGNIMLLSGMSS